MKFYAVQCGHKPGVYLTWADAQSQVNGYPRAIYKSFATQEQADAFVKGLSVDVPKPTKSVAQLNVKTLTVEKPIAKAELDIWAASWFSVSHHRVAFALVCSELKPFASLYVAEPPESPERGLICAALKVMTDIHLLPELKGRSVRLHFGQGGWPVYMSLSRWIWNWPRKGWNNGQVVSIDLYQAAHQLLLKTPQLSFDYHSPDLPIPEPLQAAQRLAEQCASDFPL